LTERLERLITAGIIEQVPAEDGTKRFAYKLTKKGESLQPILRDLRDWGLKWEKGTQVRLKSSKT
jgi:DNA-binding HxlR family transcriptional regulator